MTNIFTNILKTLKTYVGPNMRPLNIRDPSPDREVRGDLPPALPIALICFLSKLFGYLWPLVAFETRIVQLPATAAIEYVAACCRTRTRTRMKTGTKTKIGTITKTVRVAYARSPQVQCVYEPSRLSVPSIVAWRTNKKNGQKNKKRQTRPRSSAGSWPRSPNFQGM